MSDQCEIPESSLLRTTFLALGSILIRRATGVEHLPLDRLIESYGEDLDIKAIDARRLVIEPLYRFLVEDASSRGSA